jgi:hypothetical protein
VLIGGREATLEYSEERVYCEEFLLANEYSQAIEY